MRRLAVCSLMIALAACQAPPSGPDQVYIAFHQAVSRGEWDRAVTFLTPEARAAFARVGRQLAQAVGHTEDPLSFFLQGIRAQVSPLSRVETVEQTDDRARVAVEAGRCEPDAAAGECSKSEVVLERRDGRWLIVVDLPEALAPAAGADQGGA